MNACVRSVLLTATLLALSATAVHGVIKATSPLRLFVQDSTQIIQVRVVKFEPDDNRLVFDVEQDIKGKLESRSLNVVWKFQPDSKWEGILTLPKLLKRFGPGQQAILFINDTGGFWHNKGAPRKNPIAFGFTNGSWFCMESTRQEDGKLLWRLAQGEPYLPPLSRGPRRS